MKNKRFIDHNQRLDNAVANLKKKCKCGHTRVVPYSSKYEYVICTWCGSRLYHDDLKQKEYDKKVAKNNFIYNLNKCIEKSKEENKPMKKKRIIDKNKLKKRYFSNNADYFTFCNKIDITIYIVEYTQAGKIKVYYGARLGRPKKHIDKPMPAEFKHKRGIRHGRRKNTFNYFG